MWPPEWQARAVPIRLSADPSQRHQHVITDWPCEHVISVSAGYARCLRHRRPPAARDHPRSRRQTWISAGIVKESNRRQAETIDFWEDRHSTSQGLMLLILNDSRLI